MGARLCLALSPLCPQIPEACVSGDLAVGGVQNDWLVPAGKPLHGWVTQLRAAREKFFF